MASKPMKHQNDGTSTSHSPHYHLNNVLSSPQLLREETIQDREKMTINLPHNGQWSSDTNVSARRNETHERPVNDIKKNPDEVLRDLFQAGERNFNSSMQCFFQDNFKELRNVIEYKTHKVKHSSSKGHKGYCPGGAGEDEGVSRQIREIQQEARRSCRIIRDSKARIVEMHKKEQLTSADLHELSERNELLLREMERFERLTKNVQRLAENEVAKSKMRTQQETRLVPTQEQYHDAETHHDLMVSNSRHKRFEVTHERAKSEVDLTRKLNESYDMQEKLVADNAELEVKRYVLYKELMSKDQVLETCRSQVKRLQGELKLVTKENALLHEKLSKNNPEGDAAALKRDSTCQSEEDLCLEEKLAAEKEEAEKACQQLRAEVKKYQGHTADLETQLRELEREVLAIRSEMSTKKESDSGCKSTGCFDDKKGGIVPPMSKACGVCPPCPAPCNPDAPPTPAEKEVARLTIQLRNTEENFKVKITECAMLRADLMKKKEELEKEKCQHRETQNKLRELEMKFQGLAMTTNMTLGTKEQALENEVNVRALKRCYREARDEVDQLRTLIKEQNDQLQDYRVKYMQAQQMVEEQRRQMDVMDLDNTRISEQINLEIQKVKLKFQEKLQELAAIPDLLKATQSRLKDSQQAQALAEHKAEQLARELNCAREKVHVLLYQQTKPPPDKTGPAEKSLDEKQIAILQSRVNQLQEMNAALKVEIERLKSHVIKLEEAVLANERRLHEKMHECAQIGGELDRCRDESARALARAQERLETTRKCLQTTIAELEKQLAASRAQVKTAEKEREELQCRMNCQIQRLNENLEQGQLRILSLQTQMRVLRKSTSDTDQESQDEGAQQCVCKTAFANP